MTLARIFILAYSGLLLFDAATAASAMQSQRQYEDQQQRLQERALATHAEKLDQMEKHIEYIDAQRLDERVTRLEAMSETNHDLLIALLVSISVLVLEATLRLFGAFKKKAEGRG